MVSDTNRTINVRTVRAVATLSGGTLVALDLITAFPQINNLSFYLMSIGAAYTWYQSVWNIHCLMIDDMSSYWFSVTENDTQLGKYQSVVFPAMFTMLIWASPLINYLAPELLSICYGCDVP